MQVPLRSGGLETLHLVTGATVVNTDILLAVSPELFQSKRGRTVYDPRLGHLVDRQQIRFGKRVLEGLGKPRLEDTKENREIFAREFVQWAYELLERQRRQLERFHKRVPYVAPRQVEQEFKTRANGIVALDQLSSDDKRKVIALSQLETYFGHDFVYQLGKPRRQPRPQEKRRTHGWEPRHKRKANKREKW